VKTFLSFLALLLITELAFAQEKPASDTSKAQFAVDKGSVLVGGSVSFTLNRVNGITSTQFIFNPQALVFVIPNLGVGGSVQFISISSSGFTQTLIGIGPTLAYYFGDKSSSAYPFLRGGFLYTSTSSGGSSSSITGTIIDFAGGVTIMASKSVGIELGVFLQIINQSQTFSGRTFNSDSGSAGVRAGVSAFIF
jgi:hypothetical protein